MNAKDLLRLMADHGGNGSAFNVVTQKLRGAMKVATSGRGISAHHLNASEITALLIGYAGSEIAARAVETITAWAQAPISDFFTDLHDLIDGSEMRDGIDVYSVAAVRISRTAPYAEIEFADGREKLTYGNKPFGLIHVESTLPGTLIRQIATDIRKGKSSKHGGAA